MTEGRKHPNCPHTTVEFRAALAVAAKGSSDGMQLSAAEKLCAPSGGRSPVEALTAPDAALK